MSTRKYTSKLNGARVLVIGGTSGIGACVAEAVLEHGATVFVASSKSENVARAVERLKQSQPDHANNVSGHVVDLANRETQEANLVALFKAVTADQGQLDHVVFTAGDPITFEPLSNVTIEYIDRLSSVRFLGAVHLAKVAPAYLKTSSTSSITITGGALSTKPVVHMGSLIPAYTAALDGLTRGLAVELKPIRVNIISPGALRTEYIDNMPPAIRDATYDAFKKSTLLNEVGRPEDVAEAYLYCMRDRFITGAALNTNGGLFLV